MGFLVEVHTHLSTPIQNFLLTPPAMFIINEIIASENQYKWVKDMPSKTPPVTDFNVHKERKYSNIKRSYEIRHQ